MSKKNPNKLKTIAVLDSCMRQNASDDLTASDLWEQCADQIPGRYLKHIQDAAGRKAVSELLRTQKDNDGVRLYGAYYTVGKWAWKPLDIMTASQLRETFSHVFSQLGADARSLISLEERINSLLESRNAVPLDPSWRNVIAAILDGDEDVDGVEVA